MSIRHPNPVANDSCPVAAALPAQTPAGRPDPVRDGQSTGRRVGPGGAVPALVLALLGGHAWAAAVDIAKVPLSTTSTTTAKPNIMFILDDSGSMDWEFMPDEMSASNRYGYWSSQCNGVAYNPAIPYTPPVRVETVSGSLVVSNYPDVSFTAAPSDGFNSASGANNLSGRTYYRYTGSQPALSWRYTANGSVDTSTTFYTECQTLTTSTGPFTLVTMGTASADAQNYANWFSYYRKRQLTMRTAAGRAFADMSNAYRVGFTKISHTGVTGDTFLDPRDFEGTQKASFFNLLYTSGTGGFTPLRGSLSKVGRFYGNVIPGQADPVQHSCQRNYAVLSTDGYWNTNSESGTYTALDLAGNLVGQQDGTEQRPPIKDGASTIVTVVKVTPIVTRNTSTGTGMIRTTFERTRTLVETCRTSGRNGRRTTLELQRRNDDATAANRVLVEDLPSTETRTTVITNGVSGNPTVRTVNGTTVAVSDRYDTPGAAVTGTWNTVTSNRGDCIIGNQPALSDTATTPVQTGVTRGWATLVGVTNPVVTQAILPTDPSLVRETSTTTTTVGDSNSLADVAQYYWKNDLRPSMVNNVPASGDDSATYQHMTTFTIGLGLKGTLNYDRNYLTLPTGDFADIRAGTKNWPVPRGTTGGSENATHIDDLWHTAVNGRGQYFSASDPNQLDDAITTTLSAIRRVTESGAAAAASTLTPVVGDDWLFLPSFTTIDWTGDLRAFKFTFDTSGNSISPNTTAGNEIWSAGNRLETRTSARRILFNNAGALSDFNYTNLTSAGKNAPFDNRCNLAAAPSTFLAQCASLTPAAQAKVTGTNLVDYLRGATSLYLSAAAADDKVFRTRTSPLGDFVNASPVYVGKPPFSYGDAGYAAFVSANDEESERMRVVYAVANDGMLHAFKVGTGLGDASGGTELWAYVPTASMAEMWRLADTAFDNDHRFFVDATPSVSDVFDSSAGRWRTILVGGLGAGGRGYYALDITNPTAPELLWEFSDANLGYTFGNAVITKDATGTWVAAFTSGINNTGGGDGVGRLYLVNAVTGALIRTIATSAGDTTTPSNLGRLEAWVSGDTNNTALRFYAGDMLGNLWRFDHDDLLPPAGREAVLLGQAVNADGVIQPITAKPLLTEATVGTLTFPLVSFGTGRMLNIGDLSDTTIQSIYAVKDSLGETGLGVLRNPAAQLVGQTLNTTTRRVDTPAAVDWNTRNGWYVDLTAPSKERVHLDGVQLGSSTLAFASTAPVADACSQGGVSYLYQFDLTSGSVRKVTNFTSVIVGLSVVTNPDGSDSAAVTKGNQEIELDPGEETGGPPDNTLRRSSWRELTD